jgi:ferredoxin, 2Fe-2S
VAGIAAECGGCLSCATCHVYVSPEWADRLPPPSEEEQVMVECAIEVRDTSRLSCQLTYTDALDGIEIEIPASQY